MFMALGWSSEKANAVLDAASDELKEQKLLMNERVCFCYARKPESP